MNKKLILFQFLGPNKQFFDEDGADDRNQFIRYLKRDFKSAGYTSEPLKSQKLKNVYAILFFDLHSVYPIYGSIYKKFKFLIFNKLRSDTSSRNIFHEEKKLGIRIKKFLIAFEPRIICPDNFNSKYASLFDKTFSWSKDCCGGNSKNKIIKLPIPEQEYKEIKFENFSRKKTLVTISSNKGSYEKKSLCKMKYDIYEELSKYFRNQFDLYGYMWDQSFISWFLKFIRGTKSKYFLIKPKYFKGTVRNKESILKNYKFCLVIENMSDYSFITEKIFHAINAGCVPVYYGAPNISQIIPKQCFINMRDFESWRKLFDYLTDFTIQDYQEFLLNRKKFLNSKEYKKFTSQEFSNDIISNVLYR